MIREACSNCGSVHPDRNGRIHNRGQSFQYRNAKQQFAADGEFKVIGEESGAIDRKQLPERNVLRVIYRIFELSLTQLPGTGGLQKSNKQWICIVPDANSC